MIVVVMMGGVGVSGDGAVDGCPGVGTRTKMTDRVYCRYFYPSVRT